MWWENFIADPHKVSLLPRDTLEKSLISSEKQLEKIHAKYYAASETIKKLCYDYGKFISDNEIQFYDKDVSEFGGEGNKQIFQQYLGFSTKRDLLDENITIAERILSKVDAVPKPGKNPIQRENQIQIVARMISLISQLAQESQNLDEKLNYNLAADVLYKDTKHIKRRFVKLRNAQQNQGFSIHIDASALNLEAIRLASEIYNLQTEANQQIMRNSQSKLEFLLKDSIKNMGDTNKQITMKNLEIEELKKQRSKIQDEITEILQKYKGGTAENIDELILQETSELRMKLTELQLLENDLLQKNRRLKSQIRSTEELKTSDEDRTIQLQKEVNVIQNSLKKFADPPETITIDYTEDEINYIRSILDDPPSQEKIDELKSNIDTMQLKHNTLENNNKTLKQQIQEFKERSKSLKALIASSKTSSSSSSSFKEEEEKAEQNSSKDIVVVDDL